MIEALIDVAEFAVKAGIVFVAVAILLTIVLSALRHRRGGDRRLTVTEMRHSVEGLRDAIEGDLMPRKGRKKELKRRRKERHKREEPERRVFVVDFEGDIAASQVSNLRSLVSALLGIATPEDEVVIRLESPGGLVPQYGLAASQLARLRHKGIPLTVCVDKIAASGGYLMACQADRIICAPFAVIGSIGVVAPVPNLHRLLERHGVDYEEVTAGRFKRTVSLLGEISEEGRQKFREQLEDIHALFKEAVAHNRKDLDVDAVATGEYWFGRRAIDLKLADEIRTSDDYLLERLETARVVHIKLEEERSLRERVGLGVEALADRLLIRWLTRLLGARYA